jgi:SUKH-4 immunity protein
VAERDPRYPEIRQLWAGRPTPVPVVDLDGRPVPARTRAVLKEVGLPRTGPVDIDFVDRDDLLTPASVDGTDYLAVAYEHGATLAVHPESEQLWSVDPSGVLPTRFVNTDLAWFLLFLGLLEAGGEDEAGFAAVEHRLAAEDPRALDDPENWWSLLIAQQQEGFQ